MPKPIVYNCLAFPAPAAFSGGSGYGRDPSTDWDQWMDMGDYADFDDYDPAAPWAWFDRWGFHGNPATVHWTAYHFWPAGHSDASHYFVPTGGPGPMGAARYLDGKTYCTWYPWLDEDGYDDAAAPHVLGDATFDTWFRDMNPHDGQPHVLFATPDHVVNAASGGSVQRGEFMLYVQDGELKLRFGYYVGTDYDFPGTLQQDEVTLATTDESRFHYLAVTWSHDERKIRVYIDGALGYTSLDGYQAAVNVGFVGSPSYNYVGNPISEMRTNVYTDEEDQLNPQWSWTGWWGDQTSQAKLLTDAEIAARYALGNPTP